MDIKIYTNVGCGYCAKAKELCDRAEVSYTEIRVGRDVSIDEFRELFPDKQSFPQVVIDDEHVGGLIDSVKWFVQNGLVSRTKK